jgi:hypothetical protein
MRLHVFSSLLGAASLAATYEFPPWTPPSSSDVRSPCPALNTIANHGIIPHTGRGLTVGMLQKALGETYNIAIDVSTVFALGGLLTSPHPFKGTFDLSDLKKHNFIEHDASLSRADLAVSGDAVTFRPDIFQGVMDTYDGMINTTLETAVLARSKRIAQARAQDPKIDFGAKLVDSPHAFRFGIRCQLDAPGGTRISSCLFM